MDKVSDTPRTDAEFTDDYYVSGFVPTKFAQQLERELAAQNERFRVLEDEMLVLGDERLCATLDAKENMEIANEFKGLMEQYRQREAEANKQSHKLEEEFKQYRKDHCGCLLKECPDCFETEMK